MTQIRSFTRLVRYVSILSSLAALLLSATAASAVTQDGTAADTHYGWFGSLDYRSQYGQFWFPEPFRLDETDVDNEVRFDWVHQAGHGKVTNDSHVEIEKAFGVTTFELEIPYQSETDTTTDPLSGLTSKERTRGVGNIEISVRRPIQQFVSSDGFCDNTVGVGLELGLPSYSPVSQNTEGVVKAFDALRLGEHFSLQTMGGFSLLMGPGDAGGDQTFEYGAVAGYSLARKDLALPHVEQLIPIVELKGERGLKGENAGQNNLTGTVGLRANFDAIGPLQPRIGVGYIFPIDQAARNDFKWGIVTSLVFEY
ncbi:MAG: hypothetical protein M0T70_10540 [Geobacteraceae bacterium]|nr:hypothetical protein [Geobacteraceae bacterium]